MREFMGFETAIAQTYPDIAYAQMGQMMDAITDQGEGATLKLRSCAARARFAGDPAPATDRPTRRSSPITRL